jgi:hypothetical protein
MNYQEFRRHLGKAGLTVNEYAALAEVRPSSISNYAKKTDVPRVHAVIAVMLGEAADRGVNFREVLARFGLSIHLRGRNVTALTEFRKRSSRRSGPTS